MSKHRAAVVLFVALAALASPVAAQDGLDMARVEDLHARGKKHYEQTMNVDLSNHERNQHRKEAFTLLNEAYGILDKWCDEHPEDIDRFEDLMVEIGQMRYWIRKESPVGLLEEDDSNVRKGTPPDWPDKPPEDLKDPALPESDPPAAGAAPAPAPAAPRLDPVEEHLKYAEKYAKEHPYDLPGIRDIYLEILEHAMPGSAPYVTALKAVSEVNSRMKDFYRRLRDEDPDQLDLTGQEERKLVWELQKDLKDREPDVRLRAAEYLGLLGSGEAARHLVKQLQREREDKVVEMILRALEKIGGSKVTEELAGLRKERDEELQRAAIGVLDAILKRSEVEARYAALALGEFVFARSDSVAEEAVGRLESLGPKGLFGLMNAIPVRDEALKLRVIEALGNTGEGRAASVLGGLLIFGAKGTLRKFKEAAVDALKRIGKPAVPYLGPWVDHPRCKQWAKAVLRDITGVNFEYGEQVKYWWDQNGD